jgi:hypothetical protein
MHPNIANGWTEESLRTATDFLNGRVMILDGLVRVMPSHADEIEVKMTVAATTTQLTQIEIHIAAGRVPELKESTKARFLEKAREFELKEYGMLLQSNRPVPQRTLFD